MREQPANSVRVANAATDAQYARRLKAVGLTLALIGAPVGGVVWAYSSFATAAQVDRIVVGEDKRAAHEKEEADELSAEVKEMRRAHQGFTIKIVGLEKDSVWIKDTLRRIAEKQRVRVAPLPGPVERTP